MVHKMSTKRLAQNYIVNKDLKPVLTLYIINRSFFPLHSCVAKVFVFVFAISTFLLIIIMCNCTFRKPQLEPFSPPELFSYQIF